MFAFHACRDEVAGERSLGVATGVAAAMGRPSPAYFAASAGSPEGGKAMEQRFRAEVQMAELNAGRR